MNRRQLIGLLAALAMRKTPAALAETSPGEGESFRRRIKQFWDIYESNTSSEARGFGPWVTSPAHIEGLLNGIEAFLDYVLQYGHSFSAKAAQQALEVLDTIDKLLDAIIHDRNSEATQQQISTAQVLQIRAETARRILETVR